MPALRAQLAFTEEHDRLQATATTVPKDLRPNGWRYLQGWLEEGWFPFYLTGNGERGYALLLEQHWGDPMRLAAFVSVKETKDGEIKIKAVTDDVPGIPENWDGGLGAWTKEGWELSHVTGNREHGWGWLLTKTTADDAADDT